MHGSEGVNDSAVFQPFSVFSVKKKCVVTERELPSTEMYSTGIIILTRATKHNVISSKQEGLCLLVLQDTPACMLIAVTGSRAISSAKPPA